MSNVFEKDPLPWYAVGGDVFDALGNEVISHDNPDEDQELAAEIVKRVNAHDSLVEALRASQEFIDADYKHTCLMYEKGEDQQFHTELCMSAADLCIKRTTATDKIRTALSKAVGEAQ